VTAVTAVNVPASITTLCLFAVSDVAEDSNNFAILLRRIKDSSVAGFITVSLSLEICVFSK
jgi:hypothetical protein